MISTAVISGFLLAVSAPLLHRLIPRWSGALFSTLPLGLFVLFLGHVDMVATDGTLIEQYSWIPSLGIHLSFYLDGLSLLFALLITGIGALIVFYSGGYLHGDPNLGRFYMYLLGFMASMLGVVLAADVISLFIFWELTSLTSYFLIGFEHRRESARNAALQALLVTGLGGLALLAGLLLLGSAGGSLETYALMNRGAEIRAHGLYLPMLVLVLLGAFTKSAQFPFHFWLPSAMEGPAPVSAYLHSATMVKAGVYLLLRLTPVMGGTPAWQASLCLVGAVTMLGGAWLAVVQSDIKRLLAYTTVNGLGTIVFLTGLGTASAIEAAVVFLLGHALYKGSLFLSAGVVDHETGIRDIHRLRGLYRQLPLITTAVLLAGLSMAGLPPLLGFVSKELIYESVLEAPPGPWLATGAALTANALLFAATGVMLLRPFFGKPAFPGQTRHRPSIDLWLGPLVPALCGLVLGLAPFLVDTALISPAASAAVGLPLEIHLAIWHGLNPMLFLSLLTVAAGCGIYTVYVGNREKLDGLRRFGAMGPDYWYSRSLEGLKKLAAWQTRILQGGYLHTYIMTIVLTAVALTVVSMLQHSGSSLNVASTPVRFFELVITTLMVAAAFVAVFARTRLTAIVAMGMIGYGIALIFIDFGAPDLAMTQFIIETMTVILFVLVIYRLPKYQTVSTRLQRINNALVAVASGLLMTALVLVALSVQEGSRLSGFFAENSFLLALSASRMAA